MRLPNDSVDITWGQLERVLQTFPEKLREIEDIDLRNSCYKEQAPERAHQVRVAPIFTIPRR